MSAPEHHDPATLGAAQLRLDVAIAQLVQPSTEHIDRSAAAADPGVRDVDTEHATEARALRRQHTEAQRRHDHAAARRALARLIAHEQRARARRTTQAELPPLLQQLQEAVAGTGGSNGAPGTGAHRAPIALAAAELIANIERTIRWGHLATDGHNWHPETAEQLRRWAGRSGHWRTEAPAYLLAAATRAEQWVVLARATLNPPRPFSLAAACPVCQQRTTLVADDLGEEVRRPVLQVDSSGWARCIAPGCTGAWGPERLSLLAAVLEQQASDQASAR